MRFKKSSFLPGVSPEFASRPRRRRRAVLHAHARCKQRLALGLSGAALIDECGNAIGLVSMIPALQDDEEGAALEEGTFGRDMDGRS